MDFLIRKIKNENDKTQIKIICESVDNKTVKSFPNIWERFNNWEKNPPYVVEIDGKIIAFMGFTINRNNYINFYDFAVLPEYQRKGIGSALWDKVIKIATENSKTRIKCSAHIDYGGYFFYTKKVNWKPIARKGKEYKFDALIEGIDNINDFTKSIKKQTPPDKKEIERYQRLDEYFYNLTKKIWEYFKKC